jgi:hypothetical protein
LGGIKIAPMEEEKQREDQGEKNDNSRRLVKGKIEQERSQSTYRQCGNNTQYSLFYAVTKHLIIPLR